MSPVAHLHRMCAWCRRVHLRGRWRPLDDALVITGAASEEDLGRVTHDICDACSAQMLGG